MILHFIKNEKLPFTQFNRWVSSLCATMVQIPVLPIVLAVHHPSGSIFSDFRDIGSTIVVTMTIAIRCGAASSAARVAQILIPRVRIVSFPAF